MSVSLDRLMGFVESVAPRDLAEPWDSIGLQLGAPDDEIESVLLTVDVTGQVAEQAAQKGVAALVAHHPVLFDSVDSLRRDRWPGCVIVPLVEACCALYVAHTNLDWAPSANTSGALARALGLADTRPLKQKPASGEESAHLGVVAFCEPMSPSELAAYVQRRLGVQDVRLSAAQGKCVRCVAVIAGSAKGLQEAAIVGGAAAIVAGEIGHHMAIEAAQMGLSTVEVGHAASEWPGIRHLGGLIGEAFAGELEVLFADDDPWGPP